MAKIVTIRGTKVVEVSLGVSFETGLSTMCINIVPQEGKYKE